MNGIVLVGVDGSKTAQKAAEAARDLAAAMGGTLHVVSAFDNDRTEVLHRQHLRRRLRPSSGCLRQTHRRTPPRSAPS